MARHTIGNDYRVCTACGKAVFKRLYVVAKGACRECVEKRSKDIQKFREEEQKDLAWKDHLQKAAGGQYNFPHPVECLATLVDEMGGIREFCRGWASYVQRLMDEKPTSMQLGTHFQSVAKLLIQAQTHRQSSPDLQALDDEELGSRVESAAMRVLKENPELHKALIAKYGEPEEYIETEVLKIPLQEEA